MVLWCLFHSYVPGQIVSPELKLNMVKQHLSVVLHRAHKWNKLHRSEENFLQLIQEKEVLLIGFKGKRTLTKTQF